MRVDGHGGFVYRPHRGAIHVELAAGQSQVTLRVPASGSSSSIDLALLLGGEIARELGWRIFDEAAGDYLLPEELPDALKNQRDFGHSGREILTRRAKGETRFGERVAHHYVRYSRTEIIVSLFLAATLAGTAVVLLALSERLLLWIGFLIWLVLASVRALVLAAVKK